MGPSDKDQKQTNSSFPAAFGYSTQEMDNLEKVEQERLLCGSLREKPPAWLLQVATQKEITGHLSVGNAHHMTTIQFVKGQAHHAQSHSATGTEAILELFLMDDAKIKFEAFREPTHFTVKDGFENLFKNGELYKSSARFLEGLGINENSRLDRSRDLAGECGLSTEEIIALGYGEDIPQQVKFLQGISGIASIKEVATRLLLPRSKTFIYAANLLKVGLALTPTGVSVREVSLPTDLAPGTGGYDEEDDFLSDNQDNAPEQENKPTAEARQSELPPEPEQRIEQEIELDLDGPCPDYRQVITSPTAPAIDSKNAPKLVNLGAPRDFIRLDAESAKRTRIKLSDPETGILDRDAFQFFLEYQFCRAFRFGTDFSLVLFAILTDDRGRGILPSRDLNKLLTRLDGIRRDVDLMGQLGDKVYGFILPNVESVKASNLAQRIVQDLDQNADDITVWRPRLHFGIASIPKDARDLPALLEAAQEALQDACQSGTAIVCK
ncbi:diguanylate cyclase [bacterium]|nr:diguanylate cyclase [bacterium]